MSDSVLDFVREKEPRFKNVPDAELTEYVGDVEPSFLKDPAFKESYDLVKAYPPSEAPLAPGTIKEPRAPTDIRDVTKGGPPAAFDSSKLSEIANDALMGDPDEPDPALDKQLVPLGDMLIKSPEQADGPIEKGIVTELRPALNSLTTPRNLGLMLGSMGVAQTGWAAKKLVTTLWTLFMGKQAIKDAPEIGANIGEELAKPREERDSAKIAQNLTRLGIDTAMFVVPALESAQSKGAALAGAAEPQARGWVDPQRRVVEPTLAPQTKAALESVETPAVPKTLAPETEAVTAEPTASLNKTASWAIRNKSTGEVAMETFDPNVVGAINKENYEAVPILEYLQSLNKPIEAKAPEVVPPTEAPIEAPAKKGVRADAKEFGTQVLKDGTAIHAEEWHPTALGEWNPEPEPGVTPKLRQGEKKTGDLFQGEDQPFNLMGEKGSDAERIANEKAQAEKSKVEAEELAKKQQLELEPEGKPVGMGGAVAEDFKPLPDSPTSIKNAKVDAERVQRGEPPMMAPLARTWGEAWDRARAEIDKDGYLQDNLIAELQQNPRPLHDWETAALTMRRVELRNEYNKAARDQSVAAEDGNEELRQMATIRIQEASNKLLKLEEATGKGGAGTEQGRGLAARKMMMNVDFSLAELETQLRAAKGGEPLTDTERTSLTQIAADYKAKSEALEKKLAEADQRNAELAAHKAVADLAKTVAPTAQVKSLAERIVAVLEKEAAASRKYLSGKTFTISPDVLYHLTKIGALEIARGSVKLADWSVKMAAEFGDKIKPHLQEIWDRANELLDKTAEKTSTKFAEQVKEAVRPGTRDTIETVKEKIKAKAVDQGLDQMGPLAQKLARLFVEQGIKQRDPLITAVHDALKESFPEVTKRQAMDAISGYGQFKQLSKDQISLELRDLKGQMQQVGKLEDMQAKQAPLKTGVERRAPSDEERRLIKLVNEAKKKGGFVVTDPAKQLASALGARKTYLRNRLSDLRAEIAAKQKLIKTKAPTPTDRELDRLKSEYEQVKQEHAAMFPKAPMTDAQRIAAANRSLDREIGQLESDLDAGRVTPAKGKPPIETPELTAKRAWLQALREHRNELRALDEHFQADQAQKALLRQKVLLEQGIAEKQKKLATGDISTAGKPINRPADPLLESLYQQRDELNKQLADAKKKPEAQKYAESIARRLEAMQKRITEKEAKLASGDVSAKGRPVNRPLTPELEAAQQQLDALNKQINELRHPKKTPEEISLQAFKTRTANRLAELESKLASGDFTAKPKRTTVLDRDAMTAKAELEGVKLRFEEAKRKAELARRTPWEKLLDWGTKYRRFGVLSSPLVIPKLISAGIQRLASMPMEELVGSALKIVPGVKEVSAKAPLEGGGLNIHAELAGYKSAFMQGMKDAWSVLRKGLSYLDVLYGKPMDSYSGEFELGSAILAFPGRLHGFLKSPVKRAAFERAVVRLSEFYTKQGLDPADPLVQTRIGVEAFKAANRSIFLNDNFIASKVSAFLSEKVNKETGHAYFGSKVLSTAGRVALPIVRVPTNIVAETMQYIGGIASGGVRLASALAKGTEKLTPGEADLIMRELKKGSVGAAVLLLGYFGAENIGGYYQPGKKKKDDEAIKPGTIRMFGVDIPSWALHNPLLETLQFGATIRKVAESKLRKKDDEPQGMVAGIGAAALGLVEETPFVREMSELEKLRNPYRREGFVGEQIKSMAVPSVVQKAAQWTDPLERKPTNIWEHVESGIPGLRQRVPEK